MSAPQDKNKNDVGIGFAGISSLVSDVDTAPPRSAKVEPEGPSSTSSGTPPPTARDAQPDQRQTYQPPPRLPSLSSGAKWAFGVAAVIAAIWLIDQAYRPAQSRSPVYSPPVQASTSSYSTPALSLKPWEKGQEVASAPNYSPPAQSRQRQPPVLAPTPPQAQAQVPSRPTESEPPVGQDLVFSMEQIQYCLAEDIRMDGAKSALNQYSDADVAQFNAIVADYNSRCGHFRYRSGTLESARRAIEPYRKQLQAEGASRFARPIPSDMLQRPAPTRSAPDVTVQTVQRKLNELGYNAGAPDGLMGGKTRSAIIAFQRDKGLAVTGVADQALLLELLK